MVSGARGGRAEPRHDCLRVGLQRAAGTAAAGGRLNPPPLLSNRVLAQPASIVDWKDAVALDRRPWHGGPVAVCQEVNLVVANIGGAAHPLVVKGVQEAYLETVEGHKEQVGGRGALRLACGAARCLHAGCRSTHRAWRGIACALPIGAQPHSLPAQTLR